MHTQDLQLTMIAALRGVTYPPSGFIVVATDLHYCKDGAIGVSDLIAGEPDREGES